MGREAASTGDKRYPKEMKAGSGGDTEADSIELRHASQGFPGRALEKMSIPQLPSEQRIHSSLAAEINSSDEHGRSFKWTIRRGFNRVFVVLGVAWYIIAGVLLVPAWSIALRSERTAAAEVAALTNGPGVSSASHANDAINQPQETSKSDPPTSEAEPWRKPLPRELEEEWDCAAARYQAQQRLQEAQQLRPVELTVELLAAPFLAAILFMVLAWVARGFRLQV